MTKVGQNVAVRGEDPLRSPISALRSPLLRPLSPPPVDDEVRALEHELDEASQRVAQLRSSMRATLQERLTEQLAHMRPAGAGPEPTAEQAGGEAEGGADEAEEQGDVGMPALPAQLAEQAAELHARLAAAAGRLPALRARLEEASGRLQRVTGFAEGVLDGPPPNTVEKAVMGKTPGRPQDRSSGTQAAGGGSAAAAPGGPQGLQPLPCAALAADAAVDK